MSTNHEKIDQLLIKLEYLLKKQESFSKEINELSYEIYQLKNAEEEQFNEKGIHEVKLPSQLDPEIEKEKVTPEFKQKQQHYGLEQPKYNVPKITKSPKIKSNLEKFIGENLINKVGIIITVIGVAIGAKYSIEHELISPVTRIILGYLTGIGLIGFGIKLKKNYKNYSAVLVSGAMAIMYFITYAAYSFYGLIPQTFTFAIMVIFTAFTVFAAINYNRQVIAHIGLVGAYAVPLLLSEPSGKVEVLFSYMAIINIGILVIAFKKYWKPLYYVSFIITWILYFLWFTSNYNNREHFGLALTFLSIFFVIFYMTFLAYKLIKKEKFSIDDILLLLINSTIFYAIGYGVLYVNETGNQLLGLFTLCNALIHFMVSVIIYRQMLADKNLFYFVTGLVLVFITITIPIQLDGNWVTLLWAGEAALLFWIGRTKNVPIYEILSYPLIFLAFISLLQDWTTAYNVYDPEYPETRITPILNINFLTSVLLIASFLFINIINRNKNYKSPLRKNKELYNIFSYTIPALLILVLYYAFRIEIATYWNQLFSDSSISFSVEGQNYQSYYRDNDLPLFKNIWIINYTLLFLTILSFVNIRKLNIADFGVINFVLNALAIFVFLVVGLYEISELRESYLEQSLSEFYHRGLFNIGIRYASFAFLAAILLASYIYLRQEFIKTNLKMAFDFILYVTIIWVASSELISWMDICESTQSYKLGLSILWGVSSLLLIALGIWKNKKHLRIGAIALFAGTLLKLFFYDISHLNTISKTIVFVSLGILLLIISFLYNKYKHLITDEKEN